MEHKAPFGANGLLKLKNKIAIRNDKNKQIQHLIYGRGSKLTDKFNGHVKSVVRLMEDSCAATRCEQLLTHKLVYEMPCHYYIDRQVKGKHQTRVNALLDDRFN